MLNYSVAELRVIIKVEPYDVAPALIVVLDTFIMESPGFLVKHAFRSQPEHLPSMSVPPVGYLLAEMLYKNAHFFL